MPSDALVSPSVRPDGGPVGTYTYYCAIPGRRAVGMVGTLTVT